MLNILQTIKTHFIKSNPENERVVYFLGEEMTELKALRLENSVLAGEIAKELGMSRSRYSGIDSGKTKLTDEKYDLLYYNVQHAIARINKRKEEQFKDINSTELVYIPLTRKNLEKALILISKGKTISSVAITLGLNEDKLYDTIMYLSTTSEEFKSEFGDVRLHEDYILD